MIRHRPLQNGVLGLLLVACTPFLFAAPNPIAVESLGDASSSRDEMMPYQPPIEDELPTGANRPELSGGETQYQMQLLQQEVQQLRGQVEELKYQLKQMRQTQNDRYLELDGRFQRLLSGGMPAPVTDEGGIVVDDDVMPGQTDDSGMMAEGSEDEKTLYDTAVELIRSRQYDLAIAQLQAVISKYPEGKYTANAYYWLGEVYAAKPEPDYEAARQALAQVITFFPDHRKVPDAAFKLGKVYHLMGDCARATDILNQVIEQQQGKSVARLASDYLRDRVGTCQ